MRAWPVGLIGLLSPSAVCWSVIMGDLSPAEKGYTGPFQGPSERDHPAVLCTVCLVVFMDYVDGNFLPFYIMIHQIAPNAQDFLIWNVNLDFRKASSCMKVDNKFHSVKWVAVSGGTLHELLQYVASYAGHKPPGKGL